MGSRQFRMPSPSWSVEDAISASAIRLSAAAGACSACSSLRSKEGAWRQAQGRAALLQRQDVQQRRAAAGADGDVISRANQQ